MVAAREKRAKYTAKDQGRRRKNAAPVRYPDMVTPKYAGIAEIGKAPILQNLLVLMMVNMFMAAINNRQAD